MIHTKVLNSDNGYSGDINSNPKPLPEMSHRNNNHQSFHVRKENKHIVRE